LKRLTGKVIAVSTGGNEDLSKDEQDQIDVEFNGIKGDHHAGASRVAYSGDREPKGTVIRNDRQWSAVSLEELTEISQRLDLSKPLRANTVGANLCIEGIPDMSLLPRGSRLKFPSGTALTVEEYNPPCLDMGAEIARKHQTKSGAALSADQWLKPAAGRRGIVGVVDVPGTIFVGDVVTVEVFQQPRIHRY
jgi:hypothetical protein